MFFKHSAGKSSWCFTRTGNTRTKGCWDSKWHCHQMIHQAIDTFPCLLDMVSCHKSVESSHCHISRFCIFKKGSNAANLQCQSTWFMTIIPKLGIWEYMFHIRPRPILSIPQFLEAYMQPIGVMQHAYTFPLVYVPPGVSQRSQTQSHLCCIDGLLQLGTGTLHFGNVGLDFGKDRRHNRATPYKGHPSFNSIHGNMFMENTIS